MFARSTVNQFVISTTASLCIVLATGAMAGKEDDTLRTAFAKEVVNVDRYYNTPREGILLARAIWDGLIYRDPLSGEYHGNLATSWSWSDEVTLDLDLREGVTFHNGEPFDADDVVYTVNYAVDPENGVQNKNVVSWIKGAEKLGQFSVRLHLHKPQPAALEYLSGPVGIYPNEYYAEVGPEGMGLAPVGTGPYKAVEIEPGQRFILEKYEGYHDSPKGKPEIGRIDIRTIPDVNTQIAELFSGQLDFIWQVPSDQAEKLRAMDRFDVLNESTMRIGFLVMDTTGRVDENSPFRSREVRQAVAHAIDRQTIVASLLKGDSQVVHSACYPSQFGCEQDVAKYDYDPERARQLLADAGYPDGFSTDFYVYRNRDYAEAMANYLREIGIDTDFHVMKYPALRDLWSTSGVPLTFQTWGSFSINDVALITSLFFKFGSQDDAREPEVCDWLEAADNSVDPTFRMENYSKALKRIAEEAYWIPLFSYNANYVSTREVEYTPTPDEVVRYFSMGWK